MMTFALYDEHEVCLRQINLKSPDELKHQTKKSLLMFRDKIHHLNVLAFYGMTCKADKVYLVSGCCNKGRFTLTLTFKTFTATETRVHIY